MSRWTKYQAECLIRKRYNQVRREEAREGAESFVQFMKILGITMLIFAAGYVLLIALMLLPAVLLIMLIVYIFRRRKRK